MKNLFYTVEGLEVSSFVVNREAKAMVESGRFDINQVMEDALAYVEPAPEEIQLRDARNIALLKLINETTNRLILNN
tara:strand:+ start:1014 stop:1244 length:231 start_codon:yes stop_codon:yes gene_type:complete